MAQREFNFFFLNFAFDATFVENARFDILFKKNSIQHKYVSSIGKDYLLFFSWSWKIFAEKRRIYKKNLVLLKINIMPFNMNKIYKTIFLGFELMILVARPSNFLLKNINITFIFTVGIQNLRWHIEKN